VCKAAVGFRDVDCRILCRRLRQQSRIMFDVRINNMLAENLLMGKNLRPKVSLTMATLGACAAS